MAQALLGPCRHSMKPRAILGLAPRHDGRHGTACHRGSCLGQHSTFGLGGHKAGMARSGPMGTKPAQHAARHGGTQQGALSHPAPTASASAAPQCCRPCNSLKQDPALRLSPPRLSVVGDGGRWRKGRHQEWTREREAYFGGGHPYRSKGRCGGREGRRSHARASICLVFQCTWWFWI